MDDITIERVERLIKEYRRFNQERTDTDEDWLLQFGTWLRDRNDSVYKSEHAIPGKEDSIIVMFLIMVNNLTRNRLNKLINNTPLSTIMDYLFLVQLDGHGRMGKAELIAFNHLEMSSGIEVIRRLLKNGWVTEEPNSEDRRSKYVAISQAGKTLLDSLSEQVNAFYRSFCSGLHDMNKTEIIYFLERLIMRIEEQPARFPIDDKAINDLNNLK